MKQIQLTYHEGNGYLYPDLTLPEQTHHPIGKYGETVRHLTAEFAKARGIDEKLKATDSLRWVQEMNNCKACAEEAVMESIYG